ncbi:MAG: DNA cytosine methyltransferase [Oscillospiraceae bacterium]|nr:DNA cytosine methyltransferase [Oscillospiraceae bacterium]
MSESLTLGSLFDGSGGFPLGGLISGITPVWASEIEPFPIRVTTKRLPFMKHYGDVSKLNGAELEPVDIITFGSPCQDMSVAGRRAGLDGSRSNLFYEAVRIVREMRNATNGEKPRYIVWENVPGAFSSNGGEDFKAVLDTIRRVKDPEADTPRPAKWPNAGCILADDYSIAWRVFDAQYWGVPQRRKRIYLVADFAGGCAGKILFESEGLSGYSPQGFRSWQGAAGTAEEGAHPAGIGTDGIIAIENHSADSRVTVSDDGKVQTLTSRMGTGGNNVPLVMKIRCGCEGGGKGPLIQTNKSATLATNNDQTLFVPTAFGICSKDSNAMKSDNPKSGFYEAETTRTLDGNGGNPSCNQGGMAVVALEGNGARPSHQGKGYSEEDVSFTLNATEQHGVAYGIDRATYNQGQNAKFAPCIDAEVEPPMVARGPGAVAHPVYSTSKNSYHTTAEEDIVNTLVATDYKDPPTVTEEPYYIVRRLTPTECARLQGFPDWWCADLGTEEPTEEDVSFWHEVFETHRTVTGSAAKPKTEVQIVKWLKDPHADSAEYKLWGNGVALPCVCFVLAGIVYYNQLRS